MDTQFCLKARSLGHIEATNLLTFAICGQESTNVVDENQKNKIEIVASPSNGDENIKIYEEHGFFFESDSDLCPVTTFNLKTLNETDGTYIEYDGQELTLLGSTKNDLTLQVNTITPYKGSIFI